MTRLVLALLIQEVIPVCGQFVGLSVVLVARLLISYLSKVIVYSMFLIIIELIEIIVIWVPFFSSVELSFRAVLLT